MKKLTALLIAIFFCILCSGSALADEPQINLPDRHSVWTQWFDENGKRIYRTWEGMEAKQGKPQQVSTQAIQSEDMNGETAEFGFVRETKSYDHTKDHGESA